MPELAAAYTVGFLLCLMLTTLYIFLRERRRSSRAALTVQKNLKKLNLFWSDSTDQILVLESDSAEAEARKSRSAIGITGFILSLLSWAGVFFLLVIMLSERFLARSRRERRLFGSLLALDSSLDATKVRQFIDELDLMNENPSASSRSY
jgi:hypothetical protein